MMKDFLFPSRFVELFSCSAEPSNFSVSTYSSCPISNEALLLHCFLSRGCSLNPSRIRIVGEVRTETGDLPLLLLLPLGHDGLAGDPLSGSFHHSASSPSSSSSSLSLLQCDFSLRMEYVRRMFPMSEIRLIFRIPSSSLNVS